METKQSPFDFSAVKFDTGYVKKDLLYAVVPPNGKGYSTVFKALITGNWVIGGGGTSFGNIDTDSDLGTRAPVIRFDLAPKHCAWRGYHFADNELPHVAQPDAYGNTLRGYLELLTSLGVPVQYPEGWDWANYRLEDGVKSHLWSNN